MTARSRAKGPLPLVETIGSTSISIQPEARTDLYSTFRVGGPADFLVRAGTASELALAYQWAQQRDLPITIFGGGSNLLVSDSGIRGLVIVVKRPGRDAEAGLEIVEDGECPLVRVPASAPSNWFGRTAAERGWAGMAWLVGLPGNVGGAVVNNAGAHGGEMKNYLVSLRLVNRAGEIVEHDRDWLAPRYRWTTLKHAPRPRGLIVLDATFRFERGAPRDLGAIADEYADYRHRTQPTGACAGSIFKNPEGTYSGLLIEQCGLKGLRIGGAVVSDKHANFIVNDSNATAADIVALMQQIQQHVERETGVLLEPEIERIGAWT